MQLSKANLNQGPGAAAGRGSSQAAGVLDELPARFRQPDIPDEEIAAIEVRPTCARSPMRIRTVCFSMQRAAHTFRLPAAWWGYGLGSCVHGSER